MRPLKSYAEQGVEAYGDGTDVDRCPYPESSLKNLEWTIGWLRQARHDPLADDLDLEERTEDIAIRLDALRSDSKRILSRIASSLPGAKSVARTIKVPLKDWPGRCYGIASELHKSGLVKHLEAEHGRSQVTYGVYTGFISGGSMFAARPFAHHGWIEFESGLVIDPTRWVFEGATPAIAAAMIDDYDLAGRRARQAVSPRPLPSFDPEGKSVVWDCNDPDVDRTMRLLLGAAETWDRKIGAAQLLWIGNLPLDSLGVHAPEIYAFFQRTGHISMVPIDNRRYVEAMSEDDMPALPSP